MNDDKTLPETAAGEVAPALPAVLNDPPPMPAVKPALDVRLAAEIDAWFVEKFHNAITSRDTEVFNYCQAAKEELKRRLAAL